MALPRGTVMERKKFGEWVWSDAQWGVVLVGSVKEVWFGSDSGVVGEVACHCGRFDTDKLHALVKLGRVGEKADW